MLASIPVQSVTFQTSHTNFPTLLTKNRTYIPHHTDVRYICHATKHRTYKVVKMHSSYAHTFTVSTLFGTFRTSSRRHLTCRQIDGQISSQSQKKSFPHAWQYIRISGFCSPTQYFICLCGIYMYVCMYTYIYIYTYIHTCIYKAELGSIFVWVCALMHCIYIYIYIYYTCTYIHALAHTYNAYLNTTRVYARGWVVDWYAPIQYIHLRKKLTWGYIQS